MDRVRLRLTGMFLLLCALPGCAVVDVGVRNPVPGLETVAVAPFFNLSQERTVDGREFALAYYSELQKVPGFEVLPVGVAERAMIDNGLTMESPDDALELARILGVDAVVVGAVTDYDPYSPRVGLKVAWYSPKQWLFLPNAPEEKMKLVQRSEPPLPGLLRAQSPESPARVSEIPDVDEGDWETIGDKSQGPTPANTTLQPPVISEVPDDTEFLPPRRVRTAAAPPGSTALPPTLPDPANNEAPVPDPRPLFPPTTPQLDETPKWSPRDVPASNPAVRISQLPADRGSSPTVSPGSPVPPATTNAPPTGAPSNPMTGAADGSESSTDSPPLKSPAAPQMLSPPYLQSGAAGQSSAMSNSDATPPTLLFAAPPASDTGTAAVMTDADQTIPALVFDDRVVLGRDDFNPREPLMAYVRMFDSTDARLVSRLADYLELSGETRSGDLEAYMKRSDFFRKFTAHVMISEMLMLHGGESRRRFLLKQRRYK